jgi:RNA polymerase sigma-70 factor, ECF subfamily
MPNLNEQELIEQAVAGNHQAFRQLVEAYQRFVYTISYRLTGSTDESEDIMQETFIRLWKNLSRYNYQFPLKAWLGKIVTNLSLDYLKSNKRKNEHRHISDDALTHNVSESNPARNLEAGELHSAVIKFAEKLTPKQRAVFVLRDLQMLTVEEVCEMLNMKETQVKSNLYYARLSIKGDLVKYYNNLKHHELY